MHAAVKLVPMLVAVGEAGQGCVWYGECVLLPCACGVEILPILVAVAHLAMCTDAMSCSMSGASRHREEGCEGTV